MGDQAFAQSEPYTPVNMIYIHNAWQSAPDEFPPVDWRNGRLAVARDFHAWRTSELTRVF